jgi:hypothetical protein
VHNDLAAKVAVKERTMPRSLIHCCECSNCRIGKEHADRGYHHQVNLLLSRLNEPQRRWLAALEAMHIGHGGKQLMAQMTGLSPTTILRGCNELKVDLADCPDQHLRASGGGRPAAEVKDPRLEDTLEAVLALETAGDPMGRRPKAKRSSLRRLSWTLSIYRGVHKTQTRLTQSIDDHSCTRGQSCRRCPPGLLS